jgi:hypothetical protein
MNACEGKEDSYQPKWKLEFYRVSYGPCLTRPRLLPEHPLISGAGSERLSRMFARRCICRLRGAFHKLKERIRVLDEAGIGVGPEPVCIWMRLVDGAEDLLEMSSELGCRATDMAR